MANPGIESIVTKHGRWAVLVSALLGWLFDGLEQGVFSLVGRSALGELMPEAQESQIGFWFGIVTAGFLVGAATGGVLFGWLGDRIGRVRAMMLSILTYALFTAACGFVRTPEQLFVLRFIASLGMGGEWALGVALVMEVWPDSFRPLLAGLIGAAANIGFALIAVVGLVLVKLVGSLSTSMLNMGVSPEIVDRLTSHHAWRLLMISGALPALLTLFIRYFVPESQKWQHERSAGRTSLWATRDLLGVLVGAVGALAILYLWAAEGLAPPVRVAGTLVAFAVVLLGYIYPAAKYLGRLAETPHGHRIVRGPALRRMLLAAGLSGVALIGTWASVQWAPTWVDKLTGGIEPAAKGWTQFYSALGAVVGSFSAALLGRRMARRATYRLLCFAAMGSILLLYLGNSTYSPTLLACVFLAGLCTASFYGWLPLYLPELFASGMRATGQGFGYNFGRIVAAIGALQTGNLTSLFHGDYAIACSVMSCIYLVGFVLIAFAPETRGFPLPD